MFVCKNPECRWAFSTERKFKSHVCGVFVSTIPPFVDPLGKLADKTDAEPGPTEADRLRAKAERLLKQADMLEKKARSA